MRTSPEGWKTHGRAPVVLAGAYIPGGRPAGGQEKKNSLQLEGRIHGRGGGPMSMSGWAFTKYACFVVVRVTPSGNTLASPPASCPCMKCCVCLHGGGGRAGEAHGEKVSCPAPGSLGEGDIALRLLSCAPSAPIPPIPRRQYTPSGSFIYLGRHAVTGWSCVPRHGGCAPLGSLLARSSSSPSGRPRGSASLNI